MQTTTWRLTCTAAAFGLVVAMHIACGPEPAPGETYPPACTGKCDGLSSTFKDLYSDMRKVDLGDLISVSADVGTKGIDDSLGNVPYVKLAISPTELYATSATAKQDLTLHDLDELSAGLTARYGDQAFISGINALRAAHLSQHPGSVFIEARFEVGAKLKPKVDLDAGGLNSRVGFLGGTGIQATVIAPYTGELNAVRKAPLDAIKAVRGFALPRSVDDLAAMTPGESVTLSADGTVGFNVGIGLPIYITTIDSVATINAVMSAAARATLGGKLDVQLIRDAGQEVVIDVGLTGKASRQIELAAKTAWGIEGLMELKLEQGPVSLDLAQLAQKALEDLLNRKLSIAAATYANIKEQVRHTVARFAFDLSLRDQAMEQAIAQASRGDLRLAQALANRPGSGVTQVLDLTRDARSLSSHLGFRFLSLRFFREKKDLTGNVVINTSPKSQQILFDELERQTGISFTQRGHRRTAVASLESLEGRLVDADHNLRVQLREQDTFTERDQILDHLDPLLALFIGPTQLEGRLAPLADALERYVDGKCQRPACPSGPPGKQSPAAKSNKALAQYNLCLQQLQSDPQLYNLRSKASTALFSVVGHGIQGGLDPRFDTAFDFAELLYELKLDAQSAQHSAGLWAGPKSSMNVEYRLSARAIESVLDATDGPSRLAESLRRTLRLMHVDRHASPAEQKLRLDKKLNGLTGEIDSARLIAESHATEYRRLGRLAGVSYVSNALGQTELGGQAPLLTVDSAGAVTLSTIAERKAAVAARCFDDLVSAANLDVPAHQAVGYALLGSVQPSELELLVDLDFRQTSTTSFAGLDLYGRGGKAKLIDAGQFDLDELIGD